MIEEMYEGFIEEITIDIPVYGLSITKRFLPTEFIGNYHPVEYISDDGYLYLLYMCDGDDTFEYWYVVFTSPELITKYLNMEISTRYLILNGMNVYIGVREGDDYYKITCDRTLLNYIVNKFINPDELPSDKAKSSYSKEDLEKWIRF